MSNSTILDKINFGIKKKVRKIEPTAALPIRYCKFRCHKRWRISCTQLLCGFITKILPWNILAFAHVLNKYHVFLTILWPFLTSSHTFWEMETLSH